MKTLSVILSIVLIALAGAVPPAAAQQQQKSDRPGWSRGGGNWDRRSDSWDGKGGWARVNGTVTAVKDNRITVREDSGREVIVNMSEARTRLREGLKVGDRVSVVGIPTGPDRLTARALRERGTGGKAAQGGEPDDGWQHIHGRVQSVQGDTMRFRTDDGRTLTVGLSPVGQEIRQALKQGEGATVIGYEWTGQNQLRAEYVQQDSSDPSRGGAVAPSASPGAQDRRQGNWDRGAGNWDRNGGGWARINGTVTAIKGDQVTVREDGGRDVIVDMSDARTRPRQGLKVGDRVSVVGTPTGPDRLTARALRERGTGGKAAGKTAGKTAKDQPDDGWQQIHGRVQSVQGTTMKFRADDGRTLTVDLSPVGQEIRQGLAPGEGATVIGHDWTGPNELRAEYVQQDSSDPSRGGATAPSASPGSKR